MPEQLQHNTCRRTGNGETGPVPRYSIWVCWLMPLAGFLSLLWFLVRVIPKPSRATYPCQRVAFPLATSFVIWLMNIAVLTVIVKKVHSLLKYRRRLAYLFCTTLTVVTIAYTFVGVAGDGSWYEPSDPALDPQGVPRGLFPGRVVWHYNPDATSWDGVTGNWWGYIDQGHVETMLSDCLRDLVETADDAAAWDMLFRHYNLNHGKGDTGYQVGEKVVVKLNLNKCSSQSYSDNGTFTAPQLVLALLRQMVNEAGIDDAEITFYDATRYVPDVIYDLCKAEFSDVHFADLTGGDGREQVQKDLVDGAMHWADDLEDPTEVGGVHPAHLPTCVTQADYFINLASLKGHGLSGITVCAKNHFGSFMADPDSGGELRQAPKNAGLHPYIATHDYIKWDPAWQFYKRDMDTYNPLVDLMGHADLGGKTILYLIDGLYAAPKQGATLGTDCKWESEPFCNKDGWTASLLASQDPVAIDSVALDFLRSEPTIQEYEDVMDAGDTVDNYLHEAALADNPPSGAFYDPEGDGIRLESLGVHEHWNNPSERLYSGNFNPGTGIELVGSQALPDIDYDSLPNQWELQHFGGPTNANPGALCANSRDTVMAAYVAGFDPTDPNAGFAIIDQQFDLSNLVSWNGISGRVYSVYCSTNLLDGFQLLQDNVHWSSNSFIDSGHPGEDCMYYQLHVDLVAP
jgi:hypothetical protein